MKFKLSWRDEERKELLFDEQADLERTMKFLTQCGYTKFKINVLD